MEDFLAGIFEVIGSVLENIAENDHISKPLRALIYGILFLIIGGICLAIFLPCWESGKTGLRILGGITAGLLMIFGGSYFLRRLIKMLKK